MVGNTMIAKRAFVIVLAMASGCATSTTAVRDTGPELARLLQNKAATVLIETDNGGHGTGVILNYDGYILTVEHIVRDAKTITVIAHPNDASTRKSSANLISSRESDDLAIIKTELPMPAVVSFGTLAKLYQGDTVYTESYPYEHGPLVTKGYLMSKGHTITLGEFEIPNALIVDIPEAAGSSGCGLFSARDGTYHGMLYIGVQVSDKKKGGRPLLMEMFHSVKTIRAFLDGLDIKYHVEYPEQKKKMRIRGPHHDL